MQDKLFYRHSAQKYMDGLPVGNGRLAAMVCGEANRLRLALNHEKLWRGVYKGRDVETRADKLPEVRDALFAGDFAEGTRLANDAFAGAGGVSGKPGRVDPYEPAGDLFFLVDAPETDYERSLDLATGEASIHFADVAQRAFVSLADGVIALSVQSGTPRDMTIELSRKNDPTCDVTLSGLTLRGAFHGGISFTVRAVADGDGEMDISDGKAVLRGATRATVLINVETGEGGDPPMPESMDYDALFTRHALRFARALGDARVRVDLPENGKPTDERVRDFRAGNDALVPLLYFEYGRYLMASGSSGALPLNLQGKWNEDLEPPWQCDYHFDINVQMAYWMCDALGLTQEQDALFALAEKFVPHAKIAARKLYGCGGILFPLQTDAWGRATPESCGWAVWTGAAAWIACHFMERYRYTLDKTFLRTRAYPFLREVAAFYLDYLTPYRGHLAFAPSQSPENRFEGTGSYPVSIGIDAAMDIELAREVFAACDEAATALGVDAADVRAWRETASKLKPLTVDAKGRLNEFDCERNVPEPGHRHLSHLFGLYPGHLFPAGDPLRAACEKSLDDRLSHGGGHTGWSRAWVACLMARLGRADDLWTHLTALIADFATETLLDLHPPRIFQIDGNMGGAAAVCECLLSSEPGRIALLGALPNAWRDGSFENFRAHGALTVSCAWRNGQIASARIRAGADANFTLAAGGGETRVSLSAGQSYTCIWKEGVKIEERIV